MSYHVLVVSDYDDMREIFVLTLCLGGHVVTSMQLQEAAKMLTQGVTTEYDIVLVDLGRPGDGRFVEFCRQIRKKQLSACIVTLATTREHLAATEQCSDIQSLLPVDIDDLLQRVHKRVHHITPHGGSHHPC